jgi:hypothetical protein
MTERYGAHLTRVANAVRTGPFGEMRALTRLTPTDLYP